MTDKQRQELEQAEAKRIKMEGYTHASLIVFLANSMVRERQLEFNLTTQDAQLRSKLAELRGLEEHANQLEERLTEAEAALSSISYDAKALVNTIKALKF